MKAYGKKRADGGCCPGHDKFPKDRYDCTSTEARRHRQKGRKTRARVEARKMINEECSSYINGPDFFGSRDRSGLPKQKGRAA